MGRVFSPRRRQKLPLAQDKAKFMPLVREGPRGARLRVLSKTMRRAGRCPVFAARCRPARGVGRGRKGIFKIKMPWGRNTA